MGLFEGLGCALTGHDWVYTSKFRVCEYCGRLERY